MRIKNRNTAHRGAAVVELAAVLPFLMFLSVIATDWARLLFTTQSRLNRAARNGALYSCDPITQAQSPYSNVQQAAVRRSTQFKCCRHC